MATQSAGKSLLERMGYPPDAKLLIVHADDMGMSHNVNVATLEAMTKGAVSSASLMTPCAWFPEAAAMAREHPELDLGIHATLTAEWKYYRWRPVAPAPLVPGLFDSEGFMWRDVVGTALHASAKEIETELRAQVQRALDFGLRPTHLDSHMGTLFARPDYFAAYRKVAREFKIPYMIPRPTPQLLAGAVGPERLIYTEKMLAEIEAAGEPMLDHLTYHIPVGAAERLEFYLGFLKNLQPGLSQVVIHCGQDSDELRAITNSWENRVADTQAFMTPAIQEALDREGIKLARWRDVAKAVGL